MSYKIDVDGIPCGNYGGVQKNETPAICTGEGFKKEVAVSAADALGQTHTTGALESQPLAKGVIARPRKFAARVRFHALEQDKKDVQFLAARLKTQESSIWRLATRIGIDALMAVDAASSPEGEIHVW